MRSPGYLEDAAPQLRPLAGNPHHLKWIMQTISFRRGGRWRSFETSVAASQRMCRWA
jgi:hypothetical protein